MRLSDGDIVSFNFPIETKLPEAEQLIVEPTAREVNGNSVIDDLKIEKTGDRSVKVTFLSVAPTTETYNWQIKNIKNPPSTKPSERFTNIKVTTSTGADV